MPKRFKDPAKVAIPANGQEWYQDEACPALYIRASSRGKVYAVRRRIGGGKPVRHVLGTVGLMALNDARKLALDTVDRMAQGLAPTPPAAPAATKTFASLRKDYLASREFGELKPRTRTDYDRKLNHPTWRRFEALAPQELTRAMLLAICDRLGGEGRAYANLMRPGAAMYTWAVNRGVVQTSPFVRLRLPRNKAAPDPLLPDDIGRAFLALDAFAAERKVEGLDPTSWVVIYRLCAYSGQRPTTWADARWEEVDAGFTTLSVPALRSKNGTPFAVAIAPQIAKLLQAIPRGQGTIFPDVINGEGVSELRTAVRDRIAVLAGGTGKLTPWRLRSTFATTMRNWGIGNEVIDRLQGRVSGQGVIGHYVAPLPSPGDRELMNRYADTVDAWRSA